MKAKKEKELKGSVFSRGGQISQQISLSHVGGR